MFAGVIKVPIGGAIRVPIHIENGTLGQKKRATPERMAPIALNFAAVA